MPTLRFSDRLSDREVDIWIFSVDRSFKPVTRDGTKDGSADSFSTSS